MNSSMYEAYRRLDIDGSWIGLERGDSSGGYFCTPVGAEIIGWDNGIHYCFIQVFREMVFCVNPETCCDEYVYPLARNFADFLGLILAVGSTNTLQQMIWWNEQQFSDFHNDPENMAYITRQEVTAVLDAIRGLGVAPVEAPFAYVKALQADFPYERIQFTDEFYDVTGRENPDREGGEVIINNGCHFAEISIAIHRDDADA